MYGYRFYQGQLVISDLNFDPLSPLLRRVFVLD